MTLISRSTFLEYSILFCRVWLKISTQKSRSRIYPTRIWKILNFKFCLQAIITQIQTVCTFVSQWKKNKKTSDKNGDIDTELIPVNIFFLFFFFLLFNQRSSHNKIWKWQTAHAEPFTLWDYQLSDKMLKHPLKNC